MTNFLGGKAFGFQFRHHAFPANLVQFIEGHGKVHKAVPHATDLRNPR